ncbi:hypothetical protein, partial [Pseudomonas syringae]|uniref:hypothetical protein n=1 Tax=Pseudomonas syringae TaxID=317 RepID=UPI001F43BACE
MSRSILLATLPLKNLQITEIQNPGQQKARTRRASFGFRGAQCNPAKVHLVRTERLELSHLAALEPKSSV